MTQSLAHIALVVQDYDEAIAFYVGTLGFELVEDTYQPEQDKRWVVVKPAGPGGCSIVLARAIDDRQRACVGDQAGGRVFLFLRTDDFWRDQSGLTEKRRPVRASASGSGVWNRRRVRGSLRKSLGSH